MRAAVLHEHGAAPRVEEFPDPEGNTMRMTKKVADDPDFPAAQKKCQIDHGGS